MSKRLTIVVNDDQKTRWDTHADDDDAIDSTADLVRTSVEAYIESRESSGGIDIEGQVLDDTLPAIEDTESAVHDVETEVKALRTENVERHDLEEIIAEMTFIHAKDAMAEVLDDYGIGKHEEGTNER